jgi:hypothetical protein
MAKQKRKEPREHPCLQPTELRTSVRPEPGSKKRMLEGEPYISLTRLTSEGKWVVSVSHI